MHSGLRRSWSYRGVRMKILHIPQYICKVCLHCSTRMCEWQWTCYCIAFTVLCIVCCLLFTWIAYRDPCFQWEIRTSLCNDYHNGMIAGSLCYDLCVEKSLYLSYCVDQLKDTSVFRWEENIVKGRIHAPQENSTPVYEGMSRSRVLDVFDSFFSGILGNTDHSNLIKRALQFADFNQDDQLTLGEVNSLWQLLQIQEFLILFMFQDSSVFPQLNGTCGSLYAYEAVYHQSLYEKNNSSYMRKVFPNSYRWSFPEFPRRAHIALGLLEYVYLTMETENTRFYMCDLNPKNFGYTQYFEMKVSNVDGMISEPMLNKELQEISCREDEDCVYRDHCRSQCNKETKFCDRVGKQYIPDIVQICRILQDFIVYDMPPKLKYTLSHLVADCVRLGKKIRTRDSNLVLVDQTVIHDKLNRILWDELKYADNKWLVKSTAKPVPIL